MNATLTNEFKRDVETKALLSTDNSGLEAYKKRKQNQADIRQMKEDVDTLKNCMTEIKTLLREILHDRHS